MSERKTKRPKFGASSNPITGDDITDPRFVNIQSDPRYRLPSRKHKVKLDSRFSQALKDDDFSRRSKVDRYGRPVETDAERKRLKRKYEFEDDEEDEQSDDPDADDEVQRELRKTNETRDPLREGKYSDSSSSSSSSDEDSEEELDEIEDAELAPQTRSDVPTGEVSSRLAVVNLDWDNIRAQDLMAVFSSFLDSGGKLKHVAIYPSEFGKERLQREEMEGPPKEIFIKSASRNDPDVDMEDSVEDDEDDEAIKSSIIKPDDGTDFDSQALRRYQLERLRYFYAILDFSSPASAKSIYDAVDGTEYLATANFFDLRFVPDSTDFSVDTPREECSSIPVDYKPNAFVTDALQHSKVKLTWDAEDTSRKEAVARAFRGGQKEIDENDIKAYLGSDSSDSESETEQQDPTTKNNPAQSAKESSRAKMRALLGLAPEPTSSTSKSKDKAPIGNVQITFSAGLSSNNADADGNIKKRSVFANTEEEANETTLEKYVRKERERKAKRRERGKTSRDDDADRCGDDDEPPTAIPEDPNDQDEDLGFNDPFFAEPSAFQTKASSNKIRKEERLRKKKEREEEAERDQKQRAQLELLMAEDANDDDDDAGNVSSKTRVKGSQKKTMQHFNMREIERAQTAETKLSNSKSKSKSKAQKKNQARKDAAMGEVTDTFKMNTSDPRFARRLYGNHEFAIDPTNPRFKGTKGMQALLEEGRRRKDGGREGGESRGKQRDMGKKGMRGGDAADGVEVVDVKALAEKLKKRKEKNS